MFDIMKTYPVNGFRLCMDEMSGDISGRAVSPLEKGEIAFHGVGELLFKMEQVFNRAGYPQAFQEKRSFSGNREQKGNYQGIPEAVRDAESICNEKGKIFYLDIVVKSRRNASWQGVIYDETGNLAGEFQGELELLQYIENIYREKKEC